MEGPKNATVLEGSEARFNCSVSQGWRLIMWALNGTVVLSVTPREPIITNNRFTSASYEVGGDFVSQMRIHDVQVSDSGRITCSLQNSDRDASAFLSVQVVGNLSVPGAGLVVPEDAPCNVTCQALGWSPLPALAWEVGVPVSHSSWAWVPDTEDPRNAASVLSLTPQGNGTLTCRADLKDLHFHRSVTVNLTVTQSPLGSIDKPGNSLPTWAIILLAVSLSLLLILVIVLIIIFCCCCVSRREKKESIQSEVRKSADVKTNDKTFETKTESGNENFGYSPDESRITKTSSLPQTSYEFSVLEQRGSQRPHQETAASRLAPATRPHVSFDMSSPKKIRNVTLV
ncbi:immunoglobulin superfamily member 5 isoform X1 [Tamandua tetradactyla]